MKPVLIVDKEGALSVIKTVRGRKKSLRFLADYAKENGYQLENQQIALCHGEDEEGRDFMLSMLEKELHPRSVLIGTVGCAIGAHTGRGIIGVCFFDADDGKFAKYFN
jgi:fatty acid-binding protein DegV